MPQSSSWKRIAGSICAPRGFRCAATFCGLKKLGTGKGSEKGRKDDLALIVSDVTAVAAGVFTTNRVCAPPVKISARNLRNGCARAVVVNSGNANACTGTKGLRDAETMTRVTAAAVAGVSDRRNQIGPAVRQRRYRKIRGQEVLVCSTGRIGVPMPMRNVERGIRACAPLLTRTNASARAVAEAIMTSDTHRKEIAIEFELAGHRVRIGGICKGAGMIQPGMATMLAFITTDTAISGSLLRQCLRKAVGGSFNRISVDGDMSTNDSVVILANGLAGNRRLTPSRSGGRVSPHQQSFQRALNHVCIELAKMIVRDGEGVSRFVTVRVDGAKSDRDAERVARAIANSSLVRTSWCGGDPNWGRILCAAGYSGASLEEELIEVGYSKTDSAPVVWAFRRGVPTSASFARLARITAKRQFEVHVNLALGRGEFVLYAADLTEDYVAFNKGDVSDPSSLGG